MWYPQFKTVVLTSMFISVLFLTGCGKQDETKALTNDANTPAMEQTTQPTNDDDKDDSDDKNWPDSAPATTPGATTTNPDTTVATDTADWRAYGSTFQSYRTPAGDEEVKVVATIDGQGIVKKVDLEFVTHAPKSKVFQDMFAAGIAEQVVGKSIKDVKVGVVNGSSLTANGFNNAIDQIENMYYAKTN